MDELIRKHRQQYSVPKSWRVTIDESGLVRVFDPSGASTESFGDMAYAWNHSIQK